MPKPTCFISYCHEGCDPDSLHAFCSLLEETSQNRLDILIDTSLHYGDDINGFMDKIATADAILLLLSPPYKAKILSRQGGVYEEFGKLLHRYESVDQAKRTGKKVADIEGYFDLIPVLWSGSESESIPEEIMRLKHLTLTGFRAAHTDRGPIASDHSRRTYIREIKRIIDCICSINSLKTATFKDFYNENYRRLFLELKADWNNPRDMNRNYLDSLFVRTMAYKQVESQNVYFIIGRKGSGKSTVVDVMALRHRDRFKGHIAIVADDFHLDGIYTLFNFPQLDSDTRTFFRRIDCFKFAWETFFYLCAMHLVASLSDSGELSELQQSYLPPIKELLEKINRDKLYPKPLESQRATYIIYAFQAISTFIDILIKNARTAQEFFYSDLKSRFTQREFLRHALGEPAFDAFEGLLATCQKKFFISLDGFDTSFDLFRRTSIIQKNRDDLSARTIFEIEWLSSLLILVTAIKQSKKYTNNFYDLLEFCITVPRDRFFEITLIDRDSYRYHNRYWALNWSGIELAILLRKRLEEAYQFRSAKEEIPENRLEEVWCKCVPSVPWEITFSYDGRTITTPLFFYILRHTFWRPRDILLHYAKILALDRDFKKKRLLVSSEVIRRVVRDTNYEIIKSEFINEFSQTIYEFEAIVEAFRGHKQFMSFSELAELLSRVDMRFAIGPIESNGGELQKIEFLYRVGLLGILSTAELKSRFGLWHDHVFYFNEGVSLFRGGHHQALMHCTYIVHPIFAEYLELQLNGQFVLEFNWKYLHDIEGVLGASGSESL